MRVLFLHQNFPGQFRHLAPSLAAQGHRVRALAITGRPLPGVELLNYRIPGRPLPEQHGLLRDVETKLLRGEAALRALLPLAQAGEHPDLIVANPGWGEALFVKDLWPRARLLSLMEYYYRAEGGDVGFDPEFDRPDLAARMRLRMKNLTLTEALRACDAAVSPTDWQRSTMPPEFAGKLHTVFDGIDTAVVRPEPSARFRLPDGRLLQPGDPVLSFVNRNLEPYRGYHVFMRALPALLARAPEDTQVLIVGRDGVSYGAAAPAGQSWKQIFWDEVRGRLSPAQQARVHFLGALDYADYLRLLQVTAAHVYLSYPFVLGWSCLEALAAGAHVIGSATPPVQEFIEDGRHGSLVDFFDTEALAATAARALHERASPRVAALRVAARATAVARCDLQTVALPGYQRLIQGLMAGG